MGALILVMLVAFILYYLLRDPPGVELSKDPIKLIGDGSFDLEIVGESFYQKNIRKEIGLSGGKSSKSFNVSLIPEDFNKYDDKAVGVYVNQKKVGHLSKSDARKHRKLMKSLGFEKRVAKCHGTVWGGGEKKYYGIWLDYNPMKTKKHYS